MTKRGFTLIELLVVIAIIAILAAILFPVFAQAKLSAKKSASLSNIKQITLANLMYENDYDDYFVLQSQNIYEDGCGTPNPGLHCAFGGQPQPSLDWPLLLVPYIKSLGLFVDPATGDAQGFFGSGPNALPGNQNGAAQYGYNGDFLSPIIVLGQNSGGWLPSGAPFQLSGSGRSQTQAISPANTVMFTAATGSPEYNGTIPGGHQYSTPDDDFAVPPGIGWQAYAAPDRLVIVPCDSSVPLWCGQWLFNSQTLPGGLPAGPMTGATRALNPYTGAPTGFVDGHAKSLTADALAAGTDYGTATVSGNNGTGSTVIDLTKYIWSLDGTLTDVN